MGAAASVVLAVCLAAAGGSGGSSTGATGIGSLLAATSTGTGSGPAGPVLAVPVRSLDQAFTAMASLRPLASLGTGSVAAILPDTVTSARYTEFDAPYLTQALAAAGLTPAQYSVVNAQGSDATELSDAQQAITQGASVLIMDPLDSSVGAQIESYATAHGVAVIDYDRLTLGGSRSYYVSFNNVEVGTLLGQGLVACAAAEHVTKPNVLVMRGAPTDSTATWFAQGYDAVLAPYFTAGTYINVGTPPGTWTPVIAQTEFEQQFTAHRNINAVLIPNDQDASPIITYLQQLNVRPRTFPVTGQDATLVGLQDVLSGYQCGTVYKRFFQEAQAAVALAMYIRAGQTPPASLINGTTVDPQTQISVPSVLLNPTWVTTVNMNSTVIADGFVPAQQLCVAQYASACTAAGIQV